MAIDPKYKALCEQRQKDALIEAAQTKAKRLPSEGDFVYSFERCGIEPTPQPVPQLAANVAIGKDAVTREQIIEWGKLAGFETSLQRERNLERLGDFAIFARMDYAKRAALTAEKAEPIYQERTVNGFWQDVSKELHDSISAGRVRSEGVRIVYAAPQQPAQPVAQTLALTDEQQRALQQAIDVMGSNGFHWVAETLSAALAYPNKVIEHDRSSGVAGDRYQVLNEAGEALLAAGHSEAYEVVYRMMKEARALLAAQPASSLAEGGERE